WQNCGASRPRSWRRSRVAWRSWEGQRHKEPIGSRRRRMRMPNPFAPLRPVLQVLATEGQVLPATGQAVIDMVTPDLEEAYDRATGGRDETVTTVWETRRRLYHPVRPIPRREKHLFRYFLDGSARTYFIGT